MSDYFSDRENGPRPRVCQEMSPPAWGGLVAIVDALVSSGAFGGRFPERCPDGQVICGCNEDALAAAIRAEIQGLAWPLETSQEVEEGFVSRREPFAPPTLIALDFLEFVWRNVARATPGSYHDYFSHHHLSFDAAAGQAQFKEDVNRIFARNGLAYEMGTDGHIVRLLPAVLGDALRRTLFQSGDRIFDVMMEESRTKFSDPDPLVRREALERLWDCWERMKSMADPHDKRKSIGLILDRAASEATFRALLETEARALTEIGNDRLIRHHEVRQTPVIDVDHVDYLYHRLFAMMQLLIRKNSPANASP